jgi:hypothetical protein
MESRRALITCDFRSKQEDTMKTTALGAMFMFLVTASPCHAQDILEGTPLDNTPLDMRTWVPPSRDQGSHLPVETSPPRGVSNRWDYPGGYFQFQGNGRWIEMRRNGPPSYFTEVGRNQRVVEMYDSDRRIAVLLTPTEGMFRYRRSDPWRGPWSNGNFR